MRPTELRCEYAVDPLGIDVRRPRLSWQTPGEPRGYRQSAYRIVVAGSAAALAAGGATLWDSGKVASERSVNVAYAGRSLGSGERCLWRVRTWDREGRAGAWSEPAWFEMGLLHTGDWQGAWIAAERGISAPLLRTEVTLAAAPARARVYASGLGYCELRINGAKVGRRVLDPASTYYHNDMDLELGSRVFYVVHDVTGHLQAGRNAIGVMLGNGWFAAEADVPPSPSHRQPYGERPQLLLQFEAELADGARVRVASGRGWKASAGPVTYNDYSHGESYDARREQVGWDEPGFDDSGWHVPREVAAPTGTLRAQPLAPGEVVDTRAAQRVLQPRAGVAVYDFGQNFSGWSRLRVQGERGARVVLKHGARVYPDGSLDARSNLYDLHCTHVARQRDSYTLKGTSNGAVVEEWEPRFTLHGFRYVEVTGSPGTQQVERVEGRVVRNAVERVGSFRCSNELLNRIHEAAVWTFASSLQGFPQDAADRSERVGWLGDPILEDYMYNFDTAQFWAKWSDDLGDAQRPDGKLPVIAPLHWRGSTHDSYGDMPVWWSSYAVIPWSLYWFYDDERVLARHAAGIGRLVDYLGTRAREHIVEFGLGDHMEPQPDGTTSSSPRRTPPELTSTAYYHFDARVAALAAEIAGRGGEAERFTALAEQIKAAFNRRFLDPDTGNYATGSQTCNALPLALGLVPKEREQAVLANLVRDIDHNHAGHLSTGMLGTNALVNVLPRHGAADLMYRIATGTTFPSWGHMIERGATTLWESWSDLPDEKLSLNMKLLGSVQKFFYRDLAGIRATAPGFREVAIDPQVVGDLAWAQARVRTVRGEIAVHWRRGEAAFELDLTIPGNVTAHVTLPKLGISQARLTEGGAPVWDAGRLATMLPGIDNVIEDARAITLRAGSGNYRFHLSG
jgi:alpha-L-rhamnosidase